MNKQTLFTLITVLLLALAAVVSAGPPIEPPDTYANEDVLVDTDWILEHLEDDSVRLLDISNNIAAFVDGHLPGAEFLDWQEDLTNPDDSTSGQIATAEQLAELLSRLGIENDDTIVLYDNTRNLFAARAYWVLKYYQHEDVRLYNGGTVKWEEDGQDLVTDFIELEPSEYEVGEADPDIRTDWQYVVDHIDDPATLTCDTRSPDEYLGSDVRSDRGGHIPGAINLEWVHAVNVEDGTFKSFEELDELFTAAGFDPDKEIITYCQTGVRGAHTWFVLSELLGYPEVRNYDGSWEEYGNNEDSPVEL